MALERADVASAIVKQTAQNQQSFVAMLTEATQGATFTASGAVSTPSAPGQLLNTSG